MKRLVVCCDGTWNTPDQKDKGKFRPSNVVKMARAITPTGPHGIVQTVFYDSGLGTGFGLDRLTGGAFGQGISRNIQDGYRFLMNNYEDGVEIYFFGFSRGAYTVRSIGGLIRNCGLLQKIHAERIPEAYDLYRKRDRGPDTQEARHFRESFSREVGIHFMGVWDTVGALGIPVRGLRFLTKHLHEFHDVKLSRYVDHAFHAIAIDERRKPFKPTLWETQTTTDQVVEQVWFTGVHTNIGGGYADSCLSDCAFMWMKGKAEQCGLVFDNRYIASNINPRRDGRLRNSKRGLYRLTRDHIRPIGHGRSSEESIHHCALIRYNDGTMNYDPKNITAYLEAKYGTEHEIFDVQALA